MSRTLASIPAGRYVFEDALDDDGAGNGPIPIRLTLTVESGGVTADFSDSSGQVPGCVNCPAAVTASAVYYCFACLMGEAVPLNEGCFRDICVVTRPGTVTHAVYPAAVVAGNVETSQRIVDVVLGALAQAVPDRIPAASCGTMSSVAIGGEGWTYYETVGGGAGGGPGWDGESAVQCHMTNTLNTPAEALEMQYPLRVTGYHVLSNGGAGRHPGGGGIRRTLQALADCEGTILADRRTTRPYGLGGGLPGGSGYQAIDVGGESGAIPAKSRFRLGPGQIIDIQTPGGGGWGTPEAS
jgi:N-methylhydantoinase B